MIVYYSGTGNSRYCAQLLASKLGDELIDAFNFIKDGIAAELCSEKPWVFVSPTYGWQQPRIFADFIRSGSFTGSKEAYFVMSCGSEIGNAGKKIKELCIEKDFSFRGVLEVVMPENYVAMFYVPGEEESKKIIAAAMPVLETGAELIRQVKPIPEKKSGVIDVLKSSLVNSVFYSTIIKAKPFFSTDACIGCGNCERSCPMNNIVIENGRPVWGDKCTHCMRCICLCPASAIEYGRASRGKPRYHCGEYKD